MFNTYGYDVPMPARGTVTVSPGNQPPAKIDAAKATKSGAVTIYYANDGAGHFKVTVTEYKKTEDVAEAP